jgi:diguanylate cyclase (GGDEF)-like protein
MDVDGFKNYNDLYGHQAGDRCLREIARVLAETICRTGDVVARYGGEEFVFIAPATNGADALSMARKVCAAVLALGMEHKRSDFGVVTVSCGVAAMVPGERDSAQDIVKCADEALYRAKAQGRNQAVLAAAL